MANSKTQKRMEVKCHIHDICDLAQAFPYVENGRLNLIL